VPLRPSPHEWDNLGRPALSRLGSSDQDRWDVRTPLVERQIADQARAHGISEDEVLEQVLLAPQAVKELIEPAEVAAVVAFLLGPEGSRFTGVALPMDLGWTAH
jgi:NAD(P)-dependent dehydrogenase (short-subunit alcohol dehydrogenase family)